MRRKMRAFAPVSIEKLEQAREETRRQRELGWLRGPIRYRRVKVVIQGKKQKVVAATDVERRRRQEEVDAARARLRQGYGAASEWPFDFAQGKQVTREFPRSKNEHGAPAEKSKQQIPATAGRPHTATGRPVRNDNLPLAYREIPSWAKGLLLPGDPGTVSERGASASATNRSGATRTPRPVPFAFRRRR
jgi:hypothetical protein